MKKPNIALAPEGAPIIGLLALSSLCFAVLEWEVLTVIFLILLLFTVHFFRDPERVIPQDKGIAVSPADGKIIKIETRSDPINGEHRECISIFMNVFSVHVNRSPISGIVKKVLYFPGKYFNAAWDKASTDNERCAWCVKENGDEGSEWIFVQIAGFVARRIVPHAEENDSLTRGQRFGMIRFGSRVDVYLPAEYAPSVSVGEVVFAGQSVIARKLDV